MQVTFTDVLRGKNARSKMSLNYLGVRKQVVDWCLPFIGFKRKHII